MRNKIIAIGALIISSAFFLNDIPDAKLYFNISSGNSKFRDKKFDESRKVYEHILKDKDIDILKKNILRSFYEEKQYDELLKSKYKDGFLKGNSYVYTSAKSQDKKEILTKALEEYKEGMKESEDINIKKNYEIVLKMLNEEQNKDNKQQSQQDKQNQQQNKDNKDNQKDNKQEQKNNKQQDKQDQKQNKDNKDNQKDNKQDQKNNQQKDKQDQKQNKDNKDNQKDNKQNQNNKQQQDKQDQQQNKNNKDNQKDNKQEQKNNQQKDKQDQKQQNNEKQQQPDNDMNSDKSKEKSMSEVPQEMETQKLSKEDMKKAEIRAILKRLEGNEKQSFKNNERFIDISDDSNTNRW